MDPKAVKASDVAPTPIRNLRDKDCMQAQVTEETAPGSDA